MYAVVDIETTGGNARFGKITEVAIFLFDGEKIVDEYSTLIDPECPIPEFITRLTGITNEMVEDAPKFYEVAKEIVEFTEGHVFVAHNVNFDYKFIQAEFKRLGYEYKRETLCTVRFSRKVLPGHESYGLGKITKALGISLDNHHRAAADARATVDLLKVGLNQPNAEKILSSFLKGQRVGKEARKLLPETTISELPETCGVYYFHDSEGEILYVGKSVNIRQRILQHLNERTRKATDMKRIMADVTWEETGSELVALLLESHEIKRHQPPFNVKQRRNAYNYGIFQTLELDGYIRLHHGPVVKGKEPLAVFATEGAAKKVLEKLTEHFELCQKLNHLDPYQNQSQKPCWHYNLKECQGACIGEEPPQSYNPRVVKAIRAMNYGMDDFLIIDEGRTAEERAVVRITQGRYSGFGFADLNLLEGQVDELTACTKTYSDNREVVRIIRGYLKTHNVEQIIPLSA
ncbi:MAG TPA: hypothetical protein DCE41_37395 [Cytophagales bacterium]|nr:hypothetical protein [Cytophagales bacterium]HAA19420.1 hypothetical protein [Cytophagales bacterium]HAP63366.1 hypothetical protein [Cytophagales bacterium]